MLSQLTERERILLLAAIGVVVLMIFYLLGRKMIQVRKELAEEVYETQTQSTQLDRIISDYNYYRALKTGDSDEDISQMYSKLDQIMIRYNLKDKVSTMKDSTTNIEKNFTKISIEISFRSVPLVDVIRMIYDIEKNKQMNGKVDYLDFGKPFQEKEVYDVNVRISSFKRGK